jgi:hypothetical protein
MAPIKRMTLLFSFLWCEPDLLSTEKTCTPFSFLYFVKVKSRNEYRISRTFRLRTTNHGSQGGSALSRTALYFMVYCVQCVGKLRRGGSAAISHARPASVRRFLSNYSARCAFLFPRISHADGQRIGQTNFQVNLHFATINVLGYWVLHE